MLSIAATAVLAVLKLSVAGTSGSLALLSSALDAGLDLALSVMTWVLVRLSSRREADGLHRERLRLEQLGALLQTIVLIGLGGYVLQAAIRQLTGGGMTMQMQHTRLAFATTVLAGAVDLWRSVALGRAARASGSAVLAAAALGFRLDFLNTLVVLVGLSSVGMGHRAADAAAAILVSVIMMGSALHLLGGTLRGLSTEEQRTIRETVRHLLARLHGPGSDHHVMAQRFGERTLCEITVGVDGATPLRDAARLAAALAPAVEAAVENSICHVTVRPSTDDGGSADPGTAPA
jgi:cation diffusion facilitator family transporter